jgi:hypothetical protein
LQINRNWTHQLLVYYVDVTVSGDNNYNKENKKSLLDAINVAGVLVKRECRTKKVTAKLVMCLMKPHDMKS